MLDFRPSQKVTKEAQERRMLRENIPPSNTTKYLQRGVFWTTQALTPASTARLESLLKFFDKERLEKVVVPIISNTGGISLRALDWFVINFARTKELALVNSRNNIVNVYESYRTWLSHWKRTCFDAFRRGPRLFFEYDQYHYSTTVAQLNYLFWAERNGILRYAKSHVEEINADMNARIALCKQEKAKAIQKGQKRKRSELARPCHKKCVIYSVSTTVKF